MSEPARLDAIILGGAFTGAAIANLLLMQRRERKILILEAKDRFDAKVGEATVELSGLFIARRLGLWDHLSREHLPKQGLRFWFHNEKTEGLADSGETGPYLSVSVPSFQLRRDVLDEKLLADAAGRGAEVIRPARVTAVELGGEDSEVRWRAADGGERAARARWVIDATGKTAFLGRKLGLIEENRDHPTAALWCRFENLADIDGPLFPRDARWLAGAITSRRLATNHYPGFGYWVWIIPLADGATSVGLVYDKRLVRLPAGPRAEAFRAFLDGIPGLAPLLTNSRMREGDLRAYDALPYLARRYMGPGWALAGDAAAFLDPYYSPGLDHCAMSAESTARIVGRQLDGRLPAEVIERLVARHNDRFERSYRRFFGAVYRDKYFYMGEADLLSAAMLVDTAYYYLFLVNPVFKNHLHDFTDEPPYHPAYAWPIYALHRFFNRRLKRLAVNRIRAGLAGRMNGGEWRLKVNFALGARPYLHLRRGLWLWLKAEWRNLHVAPRAWRSPAADDARLADLAAATRPRGIGIAPRPPAPEAAPAAPRAA